MAISEQINRQTSQIINAMNINTVLKTNIPLSHLYMHKRDGSLCNKYAGRSDCNRHQYWSRYSVRYSGQTQYKVSRHTAFK
jgi:hypothetical protein